MKFEVGDVLVDVEGYPYGTTSSVVVLKVEEQNEGSGMYHIKYEEGIYMWRSADIVEHDFRKAPVGTVAWLIHELSNHDPTDSVSICQWNTIGWKVDVKDVEIINKFGEGAVTLW